MEAYREKYKLTFRINKKSDYIRILGAQFFKAVKKNAK